MDIAKPPNPEDEPAAYEIPNPVPDPMPEDEDGAGLPDQPEVKPLRRAVRKRVKLTPEILVGPKGLPRIVDEMQKVAFKGEGRELEDIRILLRAHERLAHHMLPAYPFNDVILRAEVVGKAPMCKSWMERAREGDTEPVQFEKEDETGETAVTAGEALGGIGEELHTRTDVGQTDAEVADHADALAGAEMIDAAMGLNGPNLDELEEIMAAQNDVMADDYDFEEEYEMQMYDIPASEQTQTQRMQETQEAQTASASTGAPDTTLAGTPPPAFATDPDIRDDATNRPTTASTTSTTIATTAPPQRSVARSDVGPILGVGDSDDATDGSAPANPTNTPPKEAAPAETSHVEEEHERKDAEQP